MNKNKRHSYTKMDNRNKIKVQKILKQENYKTNKIILRNALNNITNEPNKKIEKFLTNQKYNNDNFEFSDDDLTYQGNRIKNKYSDNKSITIKFDYNLNNKINDNDKKINFIIARKLVLILKIKP